MDKCIDHGRLVSGFGYAGISVDGRRVGLHRKVYCDANSMSLQDIAGMVIRHTCDNPRCINPNHLLLGTHWDNMNDRRIRERANPQRGHKHTLSKLSAEQVAWVRENYKPRDKVYGVRAMARTLGVYHNVISRVVREVGYR